MPGLLQKPLFRGLFKNQAPISLSLPPSLFPSLLTTPPPVKSWHPASAPFQPEIPEPAAVPWQKRPSAEAWASVCRHRHPSSLPSFPYQHKSFLFATQTRSPPKVSHELRKEERKATLNTEEPTKATAASGVMKQRQTQVRPPRPKDVWGLSGLSLKGSNLSLSVGYLWMSLEDTWWWGVLISFQEKGKQERRGKLKGRKKRATETSGAQDGVLSGYGFDCLLRPWNHGWNGWHPPNLTLPRTLLLVQPIPGSLQVLSRWTLREPFVKRDWGGM